MAAKIVVLDGYTLNPGDLSWEPLRNIGECTIYDYTSPADTIERAKGASIVLTNKTVISKEVISALPELKYIGVLATGYNVVDITFAKSRKIVVTNVPEYSTASVVQMVFALLFEITNSVGLHSNSVKQGEWSKNRDFCYWKTPLVEVAGLTMGIIGYGRIGRAVAKVAEALGMRVIVYSRSVHDVEGITVVKDINTLLRQSDVVTLHCPLTDETKWLISKEQLAMMKSSAILINTSRGPVVNEKDLAEALDKGVIAAAGIDVMEKEPPPFDSPLLRAKNCFITPHIAWATKAARQRLLLAAVNNIKAFMAGKPLNVVNP